METIQFGKMVSLAYEIFVVAQDGETSVFKFTSERPDRFVFGADAGMLEAFMRHIENLACGATFDFTLEPAEAFGEINQDYVVELGKKMFEVDGKFDSENIYEGNSVPMRTSENREMLGRVKKVTASKVIMDFNHPLAGERVRYAGQVLEVRDPTPEELKPQQGCGCGGSCSGCGDESSCGSCGGCQ